MADQNIKVMHIASGDLWAGAEAMLAALVAGQRSLPGVSISAIVLNEGELAGRLRALGVDTCVLPESSSSFAGLCLAARERVQTLRPHVIHTHRIKEDMLGAAASLGVRDTVCVRTVHGRDESQNAGSATAKLRRGLHRFCVRSRFARTFAISAALAAELKPSLHRVAHISNGIDLQSLQRLPRTSEREPLPVRVGLVGRLVPIKRIDLFIDMAALVQRSVPGAFRFHIYGDGPEHARLAQRIRESGLENVVFLEGFFRDIDVRIAALDLLYLTSDSEGLPMTVLEAMALGTPVVTAAVGELPVVLDAGASGTLVGVQQPAAYAEPALAFLRDRTPFLARARTAQSRVSELYSAEACAREYLRHYRELSGRS